MRIEPRDLRDKNRVKLWEIPPLDTPLVMWIDPSNLCNFRCVFCPTGDKSLVNKRPNGVMTMETLKIIAFYMAGFPRKIHRINLYKDGEPLVNINFVKMVKFLRECNVADEIWTTTNGALLNPKINQELADCGLDIIRISVNAVTAEGYQKICGVKLNYNKFMDNIADLWNRCKDTKISIKIADSGLTEKEIAKFYSDFEGICDYISMEGLHGWSNSSIRDFKLNTNKSFDGNPIVPKKACPITLCALSVNWNGDVTVCNEDWLHANLLGNIYHQSLVDIWKGEKLYNLRKAHLDGHRWELNMCRDCNYLSVLPDNIDEHRKEILEALNANR